MTSELVKRFRNDIAPRLLGKFNNGGVATVIRVLTPNADPLLPPSETATATEVNSFARGVSSNILTADPNLVATDVQVIVAAVDYVPTVAAHIELNGARRAIVRVDAIPAAGEPAIYRFFVR